MMDALPTVTSQTFQYDDEEGDDVELSSGKIARFQPEVYVTKGKGDDLRGRRYARQGRPDIPEIIEETLAIAKANGSGRVAVITCGPEGMVEEVKANSRKILVGVHDEIFDF